MSSNSDTDDRVEAPVTNEELYVELRKLVVVNITAMGGIMMVVAAVAHSLSPSSSLNPMLAGFFFIGMFGGFFIHAYSERSWITALYEYIPGIDIETFDELKGRLTDEDRAVTDGGEEP